MDASPFPERSMFEYIISIYLPGSLVTAAFIFVIKDIGLTEKLIANLKPEELKSNLLLALYTFYFISAPFIFGMLVDGVRHVLSSFISCLFQRCPVIQKGMLVWNFPSKEGYSSTKGELTEIIYLRQLDKSYPLYHL